MIKVKIGDEVAVFHHARAKQPVRGKVTSFSDSHIMLHANGPNPSYDPVTGKRQEIGYSGGYIRQMTPELLMQIETREMSKFLSAFDFTKLSHSQLKTIKNLVK